MSGIKIKNYYRQPSELFLEYIKGLHGEKLIGAEENLHESLKRSNKEVSNDEVVQVSTVEKSLKRVKKEFKKYVRKNKASHPHSSMKKKGDKKEPPKKKKKTKTPKKANKKRKHSLEKDRDVKLAKKACIIPSHREGGFTVQHGFGNHQQLLIECQDEMDVYASSSQVEFRDSLWEILDHGVWEPYSKTVSVRSKVSTENEDKLEIEGYHLTLMLLHKDKIDFSDTGKRITKTTCVHWLTVKPISLEGGGLVLFAAKTFYKDQIITIYLAFKCNHVDCQSHYLYKLGNNDLCFSLNDFQEVPLMWGGHFANDLSFKYEEHEENHNLVKQGSCTCGHTSRWT